MKLRVNREHLVEATNVLTSVASARSPREVLKSILVRARGDRAELEASDGEVGVRMVLTEVEVDAQGEVLVPAEKLAAIARESRDEVLDFATDASICHVKGADSHFQIQTKETADFPALPAMPEHGDFSVRSGMLGRLTERTVFAAAKESTRYALNGVLWERKGKKLALVATDGRRLAYATGEAEGDGKAEQSAILPVEALQIVQRLIRDEQELAQIKLSTNQALVGWKHATVSTPLVEGHFPRYQDVIPVDNDKKVEISVLELVSAVRRAALLTNEESRGVRFSLASGELTLSARAPQEGEVRITLPVDYQGASLDIGFNPNFLTDVLRVVHTDTVTLELRETNRPGVLRAGPDYLYVVMPVNLS